MLFSIVSCVSLEWSQRRFSVRGNFGVGIRKKMPSRLPKTMKELVMGGVKVYIRRASYKKIVRLRLSLRCRILVAKESNGWEMKKEKFGAGVN